MAADPTSVPQTAWNAIGAFVGGILTLLYASLVWSYTRQVSKNDDYAKKVDDLCSSVPRDYVPRTEFSAMEVRVAGMASRRELIAYLREHKDQQQRQHDENKEAMKEMKEASLLRDKHAQEFREEMRDKLEKLALKVESVSTIQKAQGAPGSS